MASAFLEAAGEALLFHAVLRITVTVVIILAVAALVLG